MSTGIFKRDLKISNLDNFLKRSSSVQIWTIVKSETGEKFQISF